MDDSIFREKAVSLHDLADRIRTERIPEIKEERDEFVEAVVSDLDPEQDVGDASRADKERYQKYNEQIKSAVGTAESLEHYAQNAGDEPGEFVLRELNADQFAAVLDTIEAAGSQRRGDSLPKGVGMNESLKRGVVSAPDAFDSDPGAWPAALVQVLHSELDEITTADDDEVELGNATLEEAMRDKRAGG
jgi:hypothetical protein